MQNIASSLKFEPFSKIGKPRPRTSFKGHDGLLTEGLCFGYQGLQEMVCLNRLLLSIAVLRNPVYDMIWSVEPFDLDAWLALRRGLQRNDVLDPRSPHNPMPYWE